MSLQLLENGRENAIASVMAWIANPANVPNPITVPSLAVAPGTGAALTFVVRPNRPVQVEDFKQGLVVSIVDIGAMQRGPEDVGGAIAYSSHHGIGRIPGNFTSTVLEFGIWGHSQVRRDDPARIAILRDAIRANYARAGMTDDSGLGGGAYLAEPIRIFDYTQSLTPAVPGKNLIVRDKTNLWFHEAWFQDTPHPEIRGWRMLTKIEWPEFWA